MLLKRLIQNYYEVFGDFDGILETVIGEQIIRSAATAGVSVEVYCYRALGYEFDDDVNISEWLTSRTEKLQKKLKDLRVYAGNQKIFDACYLYYRDCQDGNITIDDMVYNTQMHRNVIRGLGYQRIRDAYKTSKLLLSYKKTNNSQLYINNGIVYCGDDMSGEEFAKLEEQAFRLMLYGRYRQLDIISNQLKYIVMLSIRRPKVYTAALDIAKAAGTTYKELLSDIGINIAYQMPVYAFCNCMVWYTNEMNTIIVDDTCTDKIPCKERRAS